MVSVSGVRGIVGRSMTPTVAAAFAAAFGSHLRAKTARASPVVCVGRDTRPSGEMIAAAATSGLLATGCRVVDLGVVATPSAGVAVAALGAAGAMVVTASHNPGPWNGLKCLDAHGAAPGRDEASAIADRFRDGALDYATADQIPAPAREDHATAAHVDRVLAVVDGAAVRAAGFTVVLDSVNGAGGAGGRMLLERLGCAVVHLNAEPTGLFAHDPEPREENLGDLAARTPAAGAAIGFAQDPDADRLAIVDERGRYVGEEYTLVLAARRALDMRGGGPMACNLSTSRMIDDLAARYEGARVERTPVGEANVAAAMRASGAVIGGEGNGGVIFPPVCMVRDSISSMALVLDLLARDPARRPLSAFVDDLPRYAMIKRRLDLAAIGGMDAARQALERVRTAYADDESARLDVADGVRVDLPEGWVHLRPSNTEPIVRLIAEAATAERAGALADRVASLARLT